MADNVIASAAVGVGSTFAADDIAGVLYPRNKLIHGADGVNAGDVSTANPLPVAGTGTAGTANASVLTVQGIAAMTPLLVTEGSGTGAAVSLAIIDDWDESDRCKVNLIVGQAGIAAGTGVVGVTVPRFTLASDDAAVLSLGIMSDWDESDRAKVNLIVGQAGIAAGAGAVGVTVPRLTLASDDPAVAALQIIDNAIAGSEMQVDIVAALPTGANVIGAVTQSGTWTVTIGALAAGTNNIGDVDVLTVPADPFGVNADAASATGSISAKLRSIAAVGIPITGTVTVGAHAVTNAGTFVVQVTGAALTALELIDDAILADDVAFTPGTSKVMMVGFQADETATDSVNEGDAGAARITLDRKLIVTMQPHTQGGLLMSKTVSAASTNATSVKASAGQVYGLQVSSVNAAARYLKLYNKASAPTVGTDVPVKTFVIPGNTAGAGFVMQWTNGLEFATGIAFALTTEATDAGTTGVSANEHVVNIDYK